MKGYHRHGRQTQTQHVLATDPAEAPRRRRGAGEWGPPNGRNLPAVHLRPVVSPIQPWGLAVGAGRVGAAHPTRHVLVPTSSPATATVDADAAAAAAAAVHISARPIAAATQPLRCRRPQIVCMHPPTINAAAAATARYLSVAVGLVRLPAVVTRVGRSSW